MLNRLVQSLEKMVVRWVLVGLFLVVALFSLVFFPARARQMRAETG